MLAKEEADNQIFCVGFEFIPNPVRLRKRRFPSIVSTKWRERGPYNLSKLFRVSQNPAD